MSRHRSGVLAIALLVSSLVGLAVGLWYPDPAEGDQYTYAEIQPIRDAWWAWHVFAGASLVLNVCGSALAGWLLARNRGAVLATVGGSLMWLGAGFYAVGVGGLASAFYFGTALDEASGARMLESAQDDFAHFWGPPVAGAALTALGTIMLAVALWRARTVPRWVPVLLATIPVTFVATTGVIGTLALLPVTVATVALGWYVWRQSAEARPTTPSEPVPDAA